MEDTLRATLELLKKGKEVVLILVLMEDTLRDFNESNNVTRARCLNPCFNGRYSQRRARLVFSFASPSLNPCFNGRYSQSSSEKPYVTVSKCLNPCFNGRYSQRQNNYEEFLKAGLNPCFNGRYSQRSGEQV